MGQDTGEPTSHAGEQIDVVCAKFERSLDAGDNPPIADYVVDWEEPERTKLISELLLVLINFRWRQGEKPTREEYSDLDEVVVNEVFDNWSPASTLEETAQGSGDTLVLDSKLLDKRFHAKGSLGLVYVATDAGLHREVAVKFIRPNLSDDEESRERFLLEAEVTSRLEHPGVVPVYGLGQSEDGSLFYVMRFIQGETLDDAIKSFHRRRKSGGEANDPRQSRDVRFRELLGRFVAVCKTIAYSHNRGIVHRDIKPANVMLGRYGETMVVDWGLAMPVGRQAGFKVGAETTLWPASNRSSSSSSGSGSRRGAAGTPAFMSPEQASSSETLSPASDIYSLGATLYLLLCGKIPFDGDVHSVLCDVISGHFKRPTEMRGGVAKPLEAICLKAMSLKPEDRYRTALELAKDVENYLADAPVSAYQEPIQSRVSRWSRQHRFLTRALFGGLILLTAAGVLLAAFMGRQAQEERQLHKDSLSISARFAARTIANKADILLRVLEKEAANPELHTFLEVVNRDVKSEPARAPLQAWLDRAAGEYVDLKSRSWFICAADGSQVSRAPLIDPASGEKALSLSKNYSWRDYFHGKDQDFYRDQDDDTRRPPLTQTHISVAMESTNEDQALIVCFSAPIRPSSEVDPMGVLGMSVPLGEFADLDIELAEGQHILLIDAREYSLEAENSKLWSKGLVLQHNDLIRSEKRLRNLDDASVEFMEDWGDANNRNNFLPSSYRDPFANDDSTRWQAAFAPVIMHGRPPDLRETGWFVVVQQLQ